MLARIYHESDLLVAEALADGLFDGLDPAELAAVVSAVHLRGRAPDAGVPSPVAPPKDVRAPTRRARGPGRAACGRGGGVAPAAHPGPDDGFAEVAWRWARGQRLDRVLERAELAPGDFVRNVKQLIDLLRQLAVVAPARPPPATARRAAAALQRGVVAASAGPALAEAETWD